ncbi:hypothetical protein GL218_07522 [Daldinia childiae]|uniref:uncharacterized protein n=1 Tax=Daldinia childiae TaxID=326645 RepID=UPI001446EED5|nr:uncharacterized protein GL218_07522 [Daldinia childiae]KAF3055134.1 hypothetical protein GL218_07522 [Daldinia childiae]
MIPPLRMEAMMQRGRSCVRHGRPILFNYHLANIDEDGRRRIAEHVVALQMTLGLTPNTINDFLTEVRDSQRERRIAAERKIQLDGFKVRDIGVFHPDLDESFGSGDIVTVGRDTAYRNVNLFIDAVRRAKTNEARETAIAAHMHELYRASPELWVQLGFPTSHVTASTIPGHFATQATSFKLLEETEMQALNKTIPRAIVPHTKKAIQLKREKTRKQCKRPW